MPKQISLILPNLVTLSSLVLGILAIMVLSDENFVLAAILIMLASVLDILDGQLAAWLDAVSDIGKELDSLADVVTFGVAPTMLVYRLMLIVGVDKHIAMLTSLAFVLAGAFRLARFNTMPSDRSAYFKGMPIPMASLLLITASFWRHWQVNFWWTVAVVAVSYLMVSSFPYPKSKRILVSMSPIIWLDLAGAALIVWAITGWQAVPFSIFFIYALSGPVIYLYSAINRQLRQA